MIGSVFLSVCCVHFGNALTPFFAQLSTGAQPTTWGMFPLNISEAVAWELLQEVWPNSWRVKTQGPLAESNYLVPSPYGDAFDVLAEANVTAVCVSG